MPVATRRHPAGQCAVRLVHPPRGRGQAGEGRRPRRRHDSQQEGSDKSSDASADCRRRGPSCLFLHLTPRRLTEADFSFINYAAFLTAAASNGACRWSIVDRGGLRDARSGIFLVERARIGTAVRNGMPASSIVPQCRPAPHHRTGTYER